jgi:O-antigen biosynthesis protein WbqP
MNNIDDLDSDKVNIYNISKRIIDFVGALCGIVILSPIFIITSILIKVESRGSIIFKQIRVGKDSKPFYIYKFRSMKTDAPNMATNDLKNPEVYITRVGKFIRKTSIDELPQLFNILKGDMSIVGPRPVIEKEYDLLQLRRECYVDKIKPGVTGWAQINGRDNLDAEEKVKYDKEYLYNRSIKFDIYILLKTFKKVIKGSDIR